jgi:hypothetical protein
MPMLHRPYTTHRKSYFSGGNFCSGRATMARYRSASAPCEDQSCSGRSRKHCRLASHSQRQWRMASSPRAQFSASNQQRGKSRRTASMPVLDLVRRQHPGLSERTTMIPPSVRTGVNIEPIRFYERIGLLQTTAEPGPTRDQEPAHDRRSSGDSKKFFTKAA